MPSLVDGVGLKILWVSPCVGSNPSPPIGDTMEDVKYFVDGEVLSISSKNVGAELLIKLNKHQLSLIENFICEHLKQQLEFASKEIKDIVT